MHSPDNNDRDQDNDEFTDDLNRPPSKSALKRESDAKQKMGEHLATLNQDQLSQLDLSDTLARAVESLRVLKKKGSRAHGGMKRQKQYIGKLMRQIDIEPLEAKLREWDQARSESTSFLHQVEAWRDRLLADGDSAIDELYEEFQISDQSHRQPLRQLLRQAEKEKKSNKPPKSARVLFKLLRDEVLNASDENDAQY